MNLINENRAGGSRDTAWPSVLYLRPISYVPIMHGLALAEDDEYFAIDPYW